MAQRGPRLVLGVFVVLVLFFILRPSSDNSQPARIAPLAPASKDTSEPKPQGKSNGLSEERAHSPAELPQGLKDVQEKDSMSDKLYSYLKGHSSHDQNSHSPVPHEEHIAVPQSTNTPAKQSPPKDPICAGLPDVSDLLVVVRTPASDLYRQLPVHFLTDLRCVDFLLFSTVHQNMGPYTVHDALANFSDIRRNKHKDFELYDKLQSAQNAVADLSTHVEDKDHNLDRWTILPHVLAAFKMRPEKRWFVFIEGDTYLSVSNLMPWLKKMNPDKAIYSGAPVMIGDVELAHSGSGIILSAAALEKLSQKSAEKLENWEEAIGSSCCGDKVLAEALKESGVRLHRSFPMIQGETLLSLDWSERHWCRPAITWHRQTSQSLDMLWQFETAWMRKHVDTPDPPPMRFKDYFQMFLVPMVRQTQNRTDWDNLSNTLLLDDRPESKSQYAHHSVDACRAACDLRQTCVQYAWEPNKCRLGMVVRWGESVSSDKRMISGWNVQRVEKFGQGVSKGVCDEDDVWLIPGDRADDTAKAAEEEDVEGSGKTAMELEEEQLRAEAAEEQRAEAEETAKEKLADEAEMKSKAKEEGPPVKKNRKPITKAKDAEKSSGEAEQLLFDHTGEQIHKRFETSKGLELSKMPER